MKLRLINIFRNNFEIQNFIDLPKNLIFIKYDKFIFLIDLLKKDNFNQLIVDIKQIKDNNLNNVNEFKFSFEKQILDKIIETNFETISRNSNDKLISKIFLDTYKLFDWKNDIDNQIALQLYINNKLKISSKSSINNNQKIGIDNQKIKLLEDKLGE